MIPCQRRLFEIPDEIAYFNCAYLSPLLRAVREAGYRGIDRKGRPWEIGPDDFFAESEQARSFFARLVGASPSDVAILPSVSYGIAIAARNIEITACDRIVLLHEQFPSNFYTWHEVAKLRRAELVTVNRLSGEDWTQAVLRCMDARTKVVTVPNVHWTDGTLLHLPEIAEKCRRVGAILILDVTQSLGALPFSVSGVRPAFAICAGYKWLLGPYSIGFMYVAPEFQGGMPIEHNWLNRKDSQDFAGLVNYKHDFQPGARRFDVGERSNFTLMPMAVAALEQILKWQVNAIQTTLAAMTGVIARRAMEIGLQVAAENERAGHIIGVRFPHGLPNGIAQQLREKSIYASVRGDAVRIAPHLYNTDADIERLLDVLTESASRR